VTTQRFQDCLYILLQTIQTGDDENWDGKPIKNVRSFEDLNMKTKKLGLIVTLEDGSEFQVTLAKN
jgi:hypothetical protein